jgi:hypothetical protein
MIIFKLFLFVFVAFLTHSLAQLSLQHSFRLVNATSKYHPKTRINTAKKIL